MAKGDTFICNCGCGCEMQIQFDGAVCQPAPIGVHQKYDKPARPVGSEPQRRHDVREDFSGQVRGWLMKG